MRAHAASRNRISLARQQQGAGGGAEGALSALDRLKRESVGGSGAGVASTPRHLNKEALASLGSGELLNTDALRPFPDQVVAGTWCTRPSGCCWCVVRAGVRPCTCVRRPATFFVPVPTHRPRLCAPAL